MRVLAATNNEHKLREFREILSPMGYEVVSPKELGIIADPEENAETFEGNAEIKAKAFYGASGMTVIADDSGLETDFLNGGPGVHSARYAPGSDKDRVNKLLAVMGDTENRSARFVSAIVMLFDDGKKLVVRGECEGRIADKPSGKNGFGYDPIFYVPEFRKTFSELTPDEKNSTSHRGRALTRLATLLRHEKLH